MHLLSLLLASLFTVVELNCENLFDCQHDSLKNDTEFLPDGKYRWTPSRYWLKLNRVGQTILACGGDSAAWQVPDLVALCEVENDTVLRDLTQRSLLRKARYEYVMTDSPDQRGIDVALLYSPFSFRLLSSRSVRVETVEGMRPTRDILYASGLVAGGDTLHVCVVHFPSRLGGVAHSRPFRMQAAAALRSVADSILAVSPRAKILLAGDFNDESPSPSLDFIAEGGFTDVSLGATGSHGARATYRYKGSWGSLDHIFASLSLAPRLAECIVMDAPFLLTDDKEYGGKQPRRNYLGPRYKKGYSDHLPLVARFLWP